MKPSFYRRIRRRSASHEAANVKKENTMLLAAKDYRTWILTIAYAACFGVEITVDNYAASFFHDDYKASLIMAGLLASIFGWLNIFARALGGILSDKVGKRFGFGGKVNLLIILLLLEGLGIILFSMAGALSNALTAEKSWFNFMLSRFFSQFLFTSETKR